ncbi:GIY-YIG nuclease family protein [Macrococcoides canis]|uniref:GIY-YIG nuclease family protein n=1 Tax=Macrococcoides canis TaxID=1855823 RepID=A0A4R6C422_9STAP|nr:GIY-YIG nuclease family protein [Macrococcus canis]TDM37335.1 GIY-YIG nuclease family protein [Macrococcus canis]
MIAQGRFYKDLHQELVVQQILPTIYDGDDFPGYDKVKLSYQQLATIIHRGKRDWIAALENQKAVYLITDKSNGKLYVGLATSMSKMLLTRWSNYVANGHGGNKELVALVEEKGFDYVKENFQYTILENYNGKVDDKLVLQRESYWKEALQSRQFGYNSN